MLPGTLPARIPPHTRCEQEGIGIATLRSARWHGWQRWAPLLAAAIGLLAIGIPVFSGSGAFQTFSNGEFSTASMLFGDVQPESAQGAGSDGKTDIFLILPNGGPFGDGSPEYVWRSPLVAAYKTAIAGTDRTALRMGDFNGDNYTDIFFQIPLANPQGYYQ